VRDIVIGTGAVGGAIGGLLLSAGREVVLVARGRQLSALASTGLGLWTPQGSLFLANFFAQTKALAFGKTADEVRAEGTAEEIVAARVFPGNRPTTSIIAPALTPSVLGLLIALYEHITFVQGIVWGIDSFDQWGVELGKKLATQIAPAVAGDTAVLAEQDASTRGLIECYLAHRER